MEVTEGPPQRPLVPLGSTVGPEGPRASEKHQGNEEGGGKSAPPSLPHRPRPNLPRQEATPFSGNFRKALKAPSSLRGKVPGGGAN